MSKVATTQPPTINFIGCGRVGKTLGLLWHQHGVLQVQDVLTSSLTSAQAAVSFMGQGHAVAALADMRAADFWLLAVPDRHIAGSAAALADTQQPPAIAFHASGAMAASELKPLHASGWQTASAHCLLSFAHAESATRQFAGTPCALEGDAMAQAALQALFDAIGAHCFGLNAEHKLLYHAAAVFGTNFLPVLQATAEALWQQSGLPAALVPQLRAALLHKAVDNLLALGPAGALTGPAARGDLALVHRQARALQSWDADMGAAYAALSTLAGRLARDGHL